MTYFYFVGFNAKAIDGPNRFTGNVEHSTENEITTMAHTEKIIEELSAHYEGKYTDFIITGLYLLRKEEQSNS
ncbi:hypothetical protein [Priestia megaterium]|uniref:hypothetical protein n=1 Tax=Priestia megaterium TaxID=1404 RepID=UPI0038739BFA|nr:hypothetical protein QY062_24550 [Priestia megaterium]